MSELTAEQVAAIGSAWGSKKGGTGATFTAKDFAEIGAADEFAAFELAQEQLEHRLEVIYRKAGLMTDDGTVSVSRKWNAFSLAFGNSDATPKLSIRDAIAKATKK